MPPWRIRLANQDDVPFVLDAWTRSFRESPWAGTVRNDEYQKVQRSTIAGLLARGSRIHVATDASGSRLLGFCVVEAGRYLHYCYVKRPFRNLGLARDLVRASGMHVPGVFTHRTRASDCLLRAGWQWDPIPARVEKLGQ